MGEAAQLCEYNAEVILIPVTKLGISKTSSRVGCEKTKAGCTQMPGDLSLGRNRTQDDTKTVSVTKRGLENHLPWPRPNAWDGREPGTSPVYLGTGQKSSEREVPVNVLGGCPQQAAREWAAC